MVSDGVTDGEGECLWLLDYLDSTPNDDPATLAGHIVADAAERGNTDDLSAIVLRIKKHPF
jgi:serine/threonine protein phosphatase PrpC